MCVELKSLNEKTLKKAYFEQAKKYHPDVSRGDIYDGQIKAINEANEVLKLYLKSRNSIEKGRFNITGERNSQQEGITSYPELFAMVQKGLRVDSVIPRICRIALVVLCSNGNYSISRDVIVRIRGKTLEIFAEIDITLGNNESVHMITMGNKNYNITYGDKDTKEKIVVLNDRVKLQTAFSLNGEIRIKIKRG